MFAFVIGAIFVGPGRAAEPPLGALLADLAGADQRAAAAARQLLIRQGVPAVEALVPYLSGDNPAAAKSAFEIIMFIGNEVSVPGREAQRRRVTDLLMPLLGPQRPENLRIIGLRLLERLVPAGYDVGPLAAMLKEKTMLRDMARTALQRMDTPEARAALRAALVEADPDPDFQCALLNSLGELEDGAALPAIKALCKNSNPVVRAAAGRSLAWTGDPFNLPVIQAVIQDADEATRFAAVDARLRLLNVIEVKGGNWQIVRDAYLELLQSGVGVQQDAALAGLGRMGDGTCVSPILAAIKNADVRTRLVGLAALRAMRGVDVVRKLAEEFPAQDKDVQLALLPVLADKQHPLVFGALAAAAKSPEREVRLAALPVLGEAALVDALSVLSAAAKSADQEEAALAAAGLLALADRLREQVGKFVATDLIQAKINEADKVYVAAYEAAVDEQMRKRALVGLAACPAPEAVPAVMSAADRPELKEPASVALAAVGAVLVAAGERERVRAEQVFAKLGALAPSLLEKQNQVSGSKKPSGPERLQAMAGLVTHWWLLRPFRLEAGRGPSAVRYFDEPRVDLARPVEVGGRKIAWAHAAPAAVSGRIDLRAADDVRGHELAYAYAEITVPQKTPAVLRLGVAGGEQIWVNDVLVFENFVIRFFLFDHDRVPVELKKGTNRILLKLWRTSMDYNFCLRITTPEGLPVFFAQKTQ